MKLINRKVVNSDGIYRRETKVKFKPDDPHSQTMMGYDKRKNRLEKAIKDAIQDANSEVIKLLKNGFLEPINRGD